MNAGREKKDDEGKKGRSGRREGRNKGEGLKEGMVRLLEDSKKER
jgi:hypothetical protein